MVIRTYIDKNNTLVYNSNVNTAKNPIAELYYGGFGISNRYSRYIFHFDETRLKSLYTGGTFTDLTKLKHTLRLTNTGAFDKELLNTIMGSKERTSSFDLILFKIEQPWDEGTGYDHEYPMLVFGDASFSINPSNWIKARNGDEWLNGSGVYSGDPSSIIIATQHFDNGNENIEMDITSYVNGVLNGNTNYGLGIAFSKVLENTTTTTNQYVGFFTKYTNTFYEPLIESIYTNNIKDDRHNFFLDKTNKLYLYVNLGGTPTNLDIIPNVAIYNADGTLFQTFSNLQVNHVTKGVYSIDVTIPTTTTEFPDLLFSDVWKNIKINGITRPDIELDFLLKDSMSYFNIGDSDDLPKPFGITVTGIRRDEKVKRGDIRKVIVSARIPYTVEQKQSLDSLKYRLYVKEGKNEYTVIDFQDVEMTNNTNYFLLDTQSLLPSTYYLDIKVESNLEINTVKEVISFDVISQSDLRISQ
jgi:hypothetical protein